MSDMTVKEIADYVGITVEEVPHHLTRSLGKTERFWRCGESGRISESSYSCSCDSVFCVLGEWVTVGPEQGKARQ